MAKKLLQLARYYAAGLINVAFGYCLFAVLVWLGMQVYSAQALGYVLGVAFNYITYSRIAFAGQQGSKLSFVASYLVNYLISFLFLWITLKVFQSPYLAGLAVTVVVSLINYFVLKKWVFPIPSRPWDGITR